MTSKIQPVKLIAGPSAGKTFRPGTKWPCYLDENGERIDPRVGDMTLRGRGKRLGVYEIQKADGVVIWYVWRDRLRTHDPRMFV